ncbi:hypothetical protein QBC33DRAFT_553896 [Phialemonium atrogriseum]|uniref:Uncharacterized protein n=1 Tax=Phialemonium atrogriseum TaxID=1093897 RepID=A0AAJ0CC05_9PEZI|nr:uncharacterized protein QBC33DRAFT_553896 [Phialemonium atrogriseum]KAK1772444.1 hypothetical protein QBC33DRAFT_553896 [Phialemonium atrogriseum]
MTSSDFTELLHAAPSSPRTGKDGIGLREKWPSRPELGWLGMTPNSFATDEFLHGLYPSSARAGRSNGARDTK